MELIDNISTSQGDKLMRTLAPGARLKIAASCFSVYAFETLKEELERIDSPEFLFNSPMFVPFDVTDKFRKECREFHIPRAERERSFYGTEFEIQLKNKLTQEAFAKECAAWRRREASFRSNRSKAAMPQFDMGQTMIAMILHLTGGERYANSKCYLMDCERMPLVIIAPAGAESGRHGARTAEARAI